LPRDGAAWNPETQRLINHALGTGLPTEIDEDIATHNADAAAHAALFAGKAALQTYTEGTFTPVLTFGGGSTGITYAGRSGTYTRIGRIVHIEVLVQLTSKGSDVGQALVTALPFTVSITTPASIQINTFTAGVGDTHVQATFTGAATTIVMQKITAGAGTAGNLDDTDFTNTSILRIAGTYTI